MTRLALCRCLGVVLRVWCVVCGAHAGVVQLRRGSSHVSSISCVLFLAFHVSFVLSVPCVLFIAFHVSCYSISCVFRFERSMCLLFVAFHVSFVSSVPCVLFRAFHVSCYSISCVFRFERSVCLVIAFQMRLLF